MYVFGKLYSTSGCGVCVCVSEFLSVSFQEDVRLLADTVGKRVKRHCAHKETLSQPAPSLANEVLSRCDQLRDNILPDLGVLVKVCHVP